MQMCLHEHSDGHGPFDRALKAIGESDSGGWALEAEKGPASPTAGSGLIAGGGDNTVNPYH